MESFGHKMFISSQPVPLMGKGVLYPRLRDFFITNSLNIFQNIVKFIFKPVASILFGVCSYIRNKFTKQEILSLLAKVLFSYILFDNIH